MARARTPEGKRKVIPVRVSEPKFAAIDEARGEMSRSEWVGAAIDAYFALPLKAAAPSPREPDSPPVPVYVNPDSVYPYTESDEVAEAHARKPKNCKHSSMRIRKGVCPDCGEWVSGGR